MQFRATLQLHGKTATGISVPPQIVEALGQGKKRIPVLVSIGGHSYPSTIAPMGGEYLVPVSAENRARAKVAPGDQVDVDLEIDLTTRTIEVPADLAEAFTRATTAAEFFESLSNSHKRAYVDWIQQAKKPETRERRVAETVERLARGEKRT